MLLTSTPFCHKGIQSCIFMAPENWGQQHPNPEPHLWLRLISLPIREGEWLTEVKDGDVIAVVGLSTVLRVLSYAAYSVLALPVSNSPVVVSNPDCDVCGIVFLKDISYIVIIVIISITFSAVSCCEDGLFVDDGPSTEQWLPGVGKSNWRGGGKFDCLIMNCACLARETDVAEPHLFR